MRKMTPEQKIIQLESRIKELEDNMKVLSQQVDANKHGIVRYVEAKIKNKV